MSNSYDRLAGISLYLGQANAGLTKTGLALGSAYTYATAGATVGACFCAPVSGNLTDVWFFVTAHAGTPGVTTVELRNWNSTNKIRPGTTLHATQTITPGTTDNKWINAHFATPYSVTAGNTYWIVIADAGWTTGNTITVAYKGGINYSRSLVVEFPGYTATDGFAADPTVADTCPPIVLKFADGSLFGNPYTTRANYTSATSERGIYIAGLTEDLILTGISVGAGSTLYSGLKIYSGTTVPGGTPDLTVTFGLGGSHQGMNFFAPFTLRKNKVYRIVFTFGNASTLPSYYQIEDYATGGTDLTNAAFGGGTMYGTIDGGAGAWVNGIDTFPYMALLISDLKSIHHPDGVFG